jgi:integrase
VPAVQGNTYRRCPCAVRRDRHVRRMACGSRMARGPTTSTCRQRKAQTAAGAKGGFPTRKAAEAALAEFLGRTAPGEVAAAGRRRVGDYLGEWVAGMRPTLAASAWTNYRSLLDLYVRPRIGTVRLSAVSASTLTALYAALLAGGGKNSKPLSPTTVRLVHRVLSKALGDAVESHLLAVNPAQNTKVPARQRVEMRT